MCGYWVGCFSKMKKFLIIKPSSLGDIVHGLQIAQSIKAQMPEAHISWVVRDIFAPIVDAADVVDTSFIFRRENGVSGFIKLIKTVRTAPYDCILDFQGLARSGILTLMCQGKHKIGRSDSREGSFLAYNEVVSMPDTAQIPHALEILMEFLPKLNLEKTLFPLEFSKVKPSITVPEDNVVIFPESRRPEKEWKGFQTLTGALFLKYPNVKITWAGKKPMEGKRDWPSNRFTNLTGKMKLVDMLPLIQSARCVISNDSGPMHISAAMGKETFAIFGPTNPQSYGPYPLSSPMNHVICAPKGDLSILKPEYVLAELEGLLTAKCAVGTR